MDAELVPPLLVLGVLAFGAWTLWSLNTGRRMARTGRRLTRRLVLVLLLLASAVYALGA